MGVSICFLAFFNQPGQKKYIKKQNRQAYWL
jgi:hypothetical protein